MRREKYYDDEFPPIPKGKVEKYSNETEDEKEYRLKKEKETKRSIVLCSIFLIIVILCSYFWGWFGFFCSLWAIEPLSLIGFILSDDNGPIIFW